MRVKPYVAWNYQSRAESDAAWAASDDFKVWQKSTPEYGVHQISEGPDSICGFFCVTCYVSWPCLSARAHEGFVFIGEALVDAVAAGMSPDEIGTLAVDMKRYIDLSYDNLDHRPWGKPYPTPDWDAPAEKLEQYRKDRDAKK